ncbi:MAG TPA: alpha-ketoglutarate-dependent dioxygenase AlkB [Acidimicrobiia bacterium]|nr:alpha-ketoglutarate-dependent dioxygenase AlkB [Acidimicrobiia bacterium]
MFAMQESLFGRDEVSFDVDFQQLSRLELDSEAWLDYCPMWLEGDRTLFDALLERADWSQPVVQMYDQQVRTPRLVARFESDLHPVLAPLVEALSGRYGIRLDQLSAGFYRDGHDSVAYHGDRIARERPRSIVATISLGEARRFLIRPKGGGEGHSYSLGHGDLVVMGGSCQRTWEHAVPKVSLAGPRIALMFRHRYD